MGEMILDALLDSLKMLPFLLLIYMVIEIIEGKSNGLFERVLQSKYSTLFGAAVGLVPQCAFSVMSAKLYDKKLITTGTMLAVMLSTSDEAFVILLASPRGAATVMPLMAVKIVVAVLFGYLVNFLLGEREVELSGNAMLETDDEEGELKRYFLVPLAHTLKIFLYILIVNLLFGSIIFALGEDGISKFMLGGRFFQPMLTTLVGLIPNCASSVIITQTFVNGGISFGSCAAGLLANSGLAFVVIFKNTKQIKRNVLLLITIFAISVIVGMLINLLGY